MRGIAKPATVALLLAVVVAALSPAWPLTWQDIPLTILTPGALPPTSVGSRYEMRLQATGGAAPYAWQLAADDRLPPGIKLHPRTGRLSGTATKPGEYNFTLVLSDANILAAKVQQDFSLLVTSGLTVDWRKPPEVNGMQLEGSLLVANHTDHALTLTVIVQAVNQIGRATALGYQRFKLASNAEQEIPFGSSPGPGKYVVHADVIADGRNNKSGLRARRQTPEDHPLEVREI